MIKLCIDCKHLLQEDDMRWCTRPSAGYDLNPVDGSKQGGPENHPSYEMAFIERQADFRCGTEGRHFVARVSGDARYYRDTKQRMLDEAVESLHELGRFDSDTENLQMLRSEVSQLKYEVSQLEQGNNLVFSQNKALISSLLRMQSAVSQMKLRDN